MRDKLERLLFELKEEQFSISEIIKKGSETQENVLVTVLRFNLVQRFIEEIQKILDSEINN